MSILLLLVRYQSNKSRLPKAKGRCSAHGHRSGGGASPPEFGVGDANANCPPQILSHRYNKERSVAFKIRQNPVLAGALSQTPLGELTMIPQMP